MTSSLSLMKLFVRLSSKINLLGNPRGYELLCLCLDTISNCLHYQYEGNRPLTYAVVSYRERFFRLEDVLCDEELTLDEYRGTKMRAESFQTQEWFDGFRKKVSVRLIVKVLDELVPQLEKIEANDADAIMACISKTTVVGVLPPAGAIVVRRTARSKETDIWIATFTWSIVFNGSAKLANVQPLLFQTLE